MVPWAAIEASVLWGLPSLPPEGRSEARLSGGCHTRHAAMGLALFWSWVLSTAPELRPAWMPGGPLCSSWFL